jgi:hypothetical protein
MKADSYPQKSERVVAKGVSDSLMLLNLDNGQYYKLDEVGSRVWELCDGKRTAADVISVIIDEYEGPADAIEADILELLRDLVHEKMVVEGNQTT